MKRVKSTPRIKKIIDKIFRSVLLLLNPDLAADEEIKTIPREI